MAPLSNTLTFKPDVASTEELVDSLSFAIKSYMGGDAKEKKLNLIRLFLYYDSELKNYETEYQHHIGQVHFCRRWLCGLAKTLGVPEAATVIDGTQVPTASNSSFLDQDMGSNDAFVWDPQIEHYEKEGESEEIIVTLLYCRMESGIPRGNKVTVSQGNANNNPLQI
jgi:hypothetical protein